ncbi:glycosyltransferase [Lewinella sp. IMCC34183]|uniref:glycosyltransferase n=1 Tax=Lewinella sp. IMCC34183 TaxID=2248762 RepID=UPI000E2325AC|nr:glycosyltransferase [Lewinella sp. IMCC34183]
MLLLLLVATAVQLLVWGFIFLPALSGSVSGAPHERPVSIVVCFRNEAARIVDCLTALLAQEHAELEIIAVDDHSDDETADLIQQLAADHPQLRMVRPDFSRPGKKDALSTGIAAARHPLLLLTDADCRPVGTDWVTRMTAPLAAETADTVLGCSPYRRTPGVLNFWQRFEATQTVLQYQGLARLGLPYMGVGRNLAYTREFFTAADGFTEHLSLPGGDDDLLINRHATPTRTARATQPGSWTVSEPSVSWENYIYRKVRHQSVGFHYRRRHQLLLSAIALSHGLFYLGGLVLLLTPVWSWALALYGLRAVLVVATYVRAPVADFLGGAAGAGKVGRIPALLVADALYSFYYLFLLFATFSDRRSW